MNNTVENMKEPKTEEEIKKLETDKGMYCFEAEKDNPYPLCKGRDWSICKGCSLWANLTSPYDSM